jgi:hypothetical protein
VLVHELQSAPKIAIFNKKYVGMKLNPGNTRRQTKGSVREVDLHLKKGYSGKDAIMRQTELFRSELDSAQKKGIKEVIFIHGLGSGKLRQELINILSTHYPSFTYQDAPFSNYGYGGAIIVTLRK